MLRPLGARQVVEEDEAQDGRLESLLLYTKAPPSLPPSRTNWTRLVPSSRTNWTRLAQAAGVYEELSFRADADRAGRLEVMRAELAMHRSSAFVNARAALRAARDLLDRREFGDATKTADKALIALANYIPESDFVPSLWQLENGIDEASENRVTPDDIADASEEAWMLRGDIFAGKRMWEEALRCYDRPPPPLPSRTNWTSLVPPLVLTGHASSLPRTNWTLLRQGARVRGGARAGRGAAARALAAPVVGLWRRARAQRARRTARESPARVHAARHRTRPARTA